MLVPPKPPGHAGCERAPADQHEQPVGRQRELVPSQRIADVQRLESAATAGANDLGVQPNVDVRRRGDAVDQVLRHAGRERRAAADQRDPPRVVREVKRRLAEFAPMIRTS